MARNNTKTQTDHSYSKYEIAHKLEDFHYKSDTLDYGYALMVLNLALVVEPGKWMNFMRE